MTAKNTTKPDDKPDEAPKKSELTLPGFTAFVDTTAKLLGDSWSTDDTTTEAGLAQLAHTDGRVIGIRRIFKGKAVQTWAIGVLAPPLPEDADEETKEAHAQRFPEGTRYNAGVYFTPDPPAQTASKTIQASLLPAFEGIRPKLRAFPRRTKPRPQQATATQNAQQPKKPRKKTAAQLASAAPQEQPPTTAASAPAPPMTGTEPTPDKAKPPRKATRPKKGTPTTPEPATEEAPSAGKPVRAANRARRTPATASEPRPTRTATKPSRPRPTKPRRPTAPDGEN
uniref:Uncharacterized protein n=1 Tax=Streptomyces sp. NBC_00003 TaxID=2903608 RepID=A0AAU2V739_9ACTN